MNNPWEEISPDEVLCSSVSPPNGEAPVRMLGEMIAYNLSAMSSDSKNIIWLTWAF